MKSVKILTSILLLSVAVVYPEASRAEISLSISIGDPVAIAPPAIPVYIVPPPPVENVVWVPGYWRWSPFGYYWVPGTWVQPPEPALLWTPGYWGWVNGNFVFHEGYWGEHVGFYGGVNYGGGYGGRGFNGGGWHNGHYEVNRSVTNVTNITNVTNNYASFNGGPGGTHAVPSQKEQAFAHERHLQPTADQIKHREAAGNNPQLRASANHGKPAVAATAKPGVFSGAGVVAAKTAGHRNVMAEKHNQQVMKNPALAKGAALPNAHPANAQHNQNKPQAAPHPQAEPHAQMAPHPQAEPHPQAAHPQGEPHPEGKPEEKKPAEEHPPEEKKEEHKEE